MRRFLYPLSVEVPTDPTERPGLATPDGRLLPLQVTPAADGHSRLDFAVSLSPFETLELLLLSGQPTAALDDPLRVTEAKRLRNTQRRFAVEFDRCGTLHEVVYDGVPHLRAATSVVRNGEQAELAGASAFAAGCPLSARAVATGKYADGCQAETHLEITACKSWVKLRHVLAQPRPRDELVFWLPLAVTSATLACDFGVGGGTYGSLQAGSDAEIVWQSEFLPAGGARWSVTAAGRLDYAGEVATAAEYLPQRWFHVVDGRKALAVAVTEVPGCCQEMGVRLRGSGDVAVSFRLGETVAASAFGLCYHFLNDIPAVAAATNPQSILLPPVVIKDF
jgi:hypothetical protein